MADISISEAKSRFPELISRVAGGERFLIQNLGATFATFPKDAAN